MLSLLENEKIILKKRRHWFVMFAEAISLLLAAFLPPIALWISSDFIPIFSDILQQYQLFIVFITAAWWQLMWIVLFTAWTNYYLDILLITNKRVVDIEQHGLFARDLVELRLENIQDIKVEVMGLLPSLLKMGDLHIQSAGQAKEIILKNIPEPHSIKNLLSKLHDEAV